MAEIRTPLPVKLFLGMLTSLPDMATQAEERLVRLFGSVDARSEPLPFDSTHYYDETMGRPLYRYFLSFSELANPASIADAKIKTNTLESDLAKGCPHPARPINLDPGYLEQSKIVLASTKNFYHRILISGGIYAEVTLSFQAGEWRAFPWTFPDYKTEQYRSFFSLLRDRYRIQLRGMGFQIRVR